MTLPIFPRTPEQSSFVHAVKKITAEDDAALANNYEQFMGQLEFILDLVVSIRPYVKDYQLNLSYTNSVDYGFDRYDYNSRKFNFRGLYLTRKWFKIFPHDVYDLKFEEIPLAIKVIHKENLSFGYLKFINANTSFLRRVRDILPENYRNRISESIRPRQPAVVEPPIRPESLQPQLIKEGTIPTSTPTPERKEGDTPFDTL